MVEGKKKKEKKKSNAWHSPFTLILSKMNPSLLVPLLSSSICRIWSGITLEWLLTRNSESTFTLPFLIGTGKVSGKCLISYFTVWKYFIEHSSSIWTNLQSEALFVLSENSFYPSKIFFNYNVEPSQIDLGRRFPPQFGTYREGRINSQFISFAVIIAIARAL